MVIPPSCPGLNVEILVDGQALQEYDDIDEGPVAPNTITKYIEAISNAYFAVRVKINRDFPFPASDIGLRITLDEKHTTERSIHADKLFKPYGKIVEGRAIHIGDETDALQKFRFIAINFGEFTYGF